MTGSGSPGGFDITTSNSVNGKPVRYIKNPLYVYRDNLQSTMNRAAVRGSRDALTVGAYVIDRLQELYGEEYQLENLWWCVRRVWKWVHKIYEAGTEKENAEFLGEVREFLKVHIFGTKETLPHMRGRDRFLITLFIRHPHLFAVAVKSRSQLKLLKRRLRAVI